MIHLTHTTPPWPTPTWPNCDTHLTSSWPTLAHPSPPHNDLPSPTPPHHDPVHASHLIITHPIPSTPPWNIFGHSIPGFHDQPTPPHTTHPTPPHHDPPQTHPLNIFGQNIPGFHGVAHRVFLSVDNYNNTSYKQSSSNPQLQNFDCKLWYKPLTDHSNGPLHTGNSQLMNIEEKNDTCHICALAMILDGDNRNDQMTQLNVLVNTQKWCTILYFCPIKACICVHVLLLSSHIPTGKFCCYIEIWSRISIITQ